MCRGFVSLKSDFYLISICSFFVFIDGKAFILLLLENANEGCKNLFAVAKWYTRRIND